MNIKLLKNKAALVFLTVFCVSGALFPPVVLANPYVKFNIKQLMDMEITSVSKSPEPLSRSAAAIFVINQEDIRRSPATSIPELLRMVPGLDVAKTSSSTWAISSRGFNGGFANKLLVLIDGRSVYTPLYGGVYWDIQDMMLENIERIEVIRGPGATLWGSNAVNGVINIITKNAKNTLGGKAIAVFGTENRIIGAGAYGGQLDENTYYRAYAKYFDRDSGFNGYDAWHQGRAGLRLDRDADSENKYILEGDYFNGERDLRGTDFSRRPPFTVSYSEDEANYGGHLLWRWSHEQDKNTGSNLQIYYDQTRRDQRIFAESRYTFDIDWNAHFQFSERQKVTWGLGYRLMADDTAGDFTALFAPADKINYLYSAFLQDEITLSEDRLWLTLGSKFENNDYSGFEVEPSARLSWQWTPDQTVWAAVSRAVRTPTRFDHDLSVSIWQVDNSFLYRLLGAPRESEEVIAWELGHRIQLNEIWSVDTALFFNHYNNLTTYSLGATFLEGPYLVQPFYTNDTMQADTYGAEISTQYQVTPIWKLVLGYSFLNMELHATDDAALQETTTEGNNPKNQASLRSLVDLPYNFEFDSQLRYVDSLVALNTDGYVQLDLRLGWHIKPNLELSVVGQNLLNDHQVEFASKSDPLASQVERSVYTKLTWTF